MTIDEIKTLKVANVKCKKSLLFYTRYFFKKRFNRKFIINDHHKKISDILERVIKGELKRVIINIAPRYGKAIDVNTEIFTTTGWKKAKDIKVNDYIFGRDGNPTKVLGVYNQGITDAYKVTFSDNTNIVTCSEHLWALNHKDLSRKNKFQFKEIRKTSDLIGNLTANDGHKLWHIPQCAPLNINTSKLEIDPYLLGCWLGDGSSYKAEITTMDKYIIDCFEKNGYETSIRKHQNSGKALTYGIRNGFITKLKKLNLVSNKHIPDSYFLSSKEQRLELLRGLMDTDGTCNKKNGQISYCSTSDMLMNDVKKLVASLGGFYTEYRKSIFIRLPNNIFKLERKQKYVKPLSNRHFNKRFVKSIDRVSDRQTVCFMVDAKDSLFLAGKDLIVTHNTELAVKNFISHCIALNPSAKFIHLSYSDDLALDNSEEIKDLVTSNEFKQLFGEIEVKKDSRSKKKWYTTKGGGVLATAAGGQVTGFGAGKVDEEDEEIKEFLNDIEKKETFGGAIVIDDPIKPEDAESSTIRERVNNRFDSTIRNRVNSRNTPIIIIMQRLHPDDLCGHLIKNDPDDWEVLELPCLTKENGVYKSLWDFKHTVEELLNIRSLNVVNFERQYQQNPKPREGLLYEPFKTYSELPQYSQVKNYTDTADTGEDYLCSIDYIEHNNLKYVIDVLYTQEPNETTEPALANMFEKNGTNYSKIESNNGGRAFARNVERISREKGNNRISISWFHQSKNKESRIKSNSSTVNNTIVMPDNWHIRWPEFYDHVTNYMAKGKNKHDDAPDVLTGIVEQSQTKRQKLKTWKS